MSICRIPPGRVLGVIGESGSGKSTLARVIAGLLPAARGRSRWTGRPLPAQRRAAHPRAASAHPDRVPERRHRAEPGASVARILARPLRILSRPARRGGVAPRGANCSTWCGCRRSLADRYPGELSGGQKQRVNLARALAAEPRLILCDEVTSALDTVVGAAILELLAELRRELGVAYMFISHDLSTVRAICDEVMVLYAGTGVEAHRSGAGAPAQASLYGAVACLGAGAAAGVAGRHRFRGGR